MVCVFPFGDRVYQWSWGHLQCTQSLSLVLGLEEDVVLCVKWQDCVVVLKGTVLECIFLQPDEPSRFFHGVQGIVFPFGEYLLLGTKEGEIFVADYFRKKLERKGKLNDVEIVQFYPVSRTVCMALDAIGYIALLDLELPHPVVFQTRMEQPELVPEIRCEMQASYLFLRFPEKEVIYDLERKQRVKVNLGKDIMKEKTGEEKEKLCLVCSEEVGSGFFNTFYKSFALGIPSYGCVGVTLNEGCISPHLYASLSLLLSLKKKKKSNWRRNQVIKLTQQTPLKRDTILDTLEHILHINTTENRSYKPVFKTKTEQKKKFFSPFPLVRLLSLFVSELYVFW